MICCSMLNICQKQVQKRTLGVNLDYYISINLSLYVCLNDILLKFWNFQIWSFQIKIWSRPDFISVLLYFSILKYLELNTAEAGARGVRHFLSWTDSIKPSLQFSSFHFGLVSLEGSTFYQNFEYSHSG